jgi:probable HAF family extracellular repeat protein
MAYSTEDRAESVPSRTRPGAAAILTLALAAAGQTAAGQTLTGIGTLPGDTSSQALGVSADGSVVVGLGGMGGGYNHAVRWTRETGPVNIAPQSPFAHAHAVSADGQVIVGVGDPVDGTPGNSAFRWTAPGGMVRLDLTGASYGDAYAVNADGSVVSGYIYTSAGKRAAIWTNAGVGHGALQNLGTLCSSCCAAAFSQGYGGINAAGTVVSGDGTANGSCSGHAFRWVSNGMGGGTMTDLGHLPGQFATDSLSFGLSGDGSVVVGQSQASNNDQAFRWSQATGMRDIGFALTQGNDWSQANAASFDGSTVVGWFYDADAGETHPLLWTTARGSEDFQDYLAAHGVDVSGWELGYATAVSPDGLTIVGYGWHYGQTEGWVADLHPDFHCGSADFDCDGDLGTDADIEAFFACLAGNCPPPPCTGTADFNGDGDVGTDADIEAFFRVLGGGTC